ncbi:MAG TPA: ankyrin repeat domain-containing protein [Gemmatimonadales bacterium]|nr:ankyrin repeat domain-containing protein [Gemmatimonadales bacterium]
MYPNPQDALPLPLRPDLGQYRKRAKELAAACRAAPEAIDAWAARWITALERLQAVGTRRLDDRDATRRAGQLATFARDRMTQADCALSEAQFVMARAHGFESWPRLVRHLEELVRSGSGISTFEEAADAIVTGDLTALERLLRADPALVHARSTREHRATLLHYVSANGVEHHRQRTPANIVEVARCLLDAGAEVDAEADVYGGGSTTVGLVVTSAHPRLAGVQIALADLLLERGARLDHDIVRSCLANGCPEAAAHLAERGAAVTLEDAAGIGRVDLLAQRLDASGAAGTDALGRAMIMAAWYGRGEVVTLLLDNGVDPGIRGPDGQTALHVTAYQGDAATVELLLRRGAPVNVSDAVYGTPPLVWALHGWLVDNRRPAEDYRPLLLALAAAGAAARPDWLDDDRIRADAELHAALAARVGKG